MELSQYVDVAYPLHKASREGHDDVLLALLHSGQYEVNHGSFDLVRPLHEASLQGHLQCVRTLLNFGAQVNIRNVDGATALCEASARGNVAIVNLLLQHGALVNPPLTLSTPIHEAVLNNRWECAEVLLAHKGNPNVSDCHYGTPLHIAAARGHNKCAEILLRYGANVSATHIHASALHMSSQQQNEAMMFLLLEHGADVYAENNQGRTARDLVPATGSNSATLKDFLCWWERNPKSLSHHCRLAVRQAVGSRGLHLIQNLHLPLPQVVKDFLQYRPQRQFISPGQLQLICRP